MFDGVLLGLATVGLGKYPFLSHGLCRVFCKFF